MEKNKYSYAITLDNDILEYLRPNSGQHPKRFDAYCDLLNKAVSETRDSYTNFGTTVELEKGQFPTSISELSTEWNWHRGSVKTFLENLIIFGLAQVDSYGKFIVITMNYTDQKDAEHQPRLMSPEEQLLLRWTCGYISIEELLENCVGFFKDTQSIFSPIVPDEQHHQKGERLHKMMSHLLLQHSNIMPFNKEIGAALDKLFFVYCNKNMTRLWEMLASFGLSTLYTELSGNDDQYQLLEHPIPTEARRLLSTIAAYYLPYLRNSGMR